MHFLRVRSAHVRLAVAVALLMTVSANAATPQLINYQGVLTNPGGTPLTGTYSVTFSIWPTPVGGSPVWTEPQSVTTDAEGRFSVLLGSATSLTDAVFSGPDRWLGVAVSPDGELTPRTQIVSVAYSERTSTVDGAAGGTINGNLKVGPNDTVFTSYLSSNSPLRLQTAGTTRMFISDADGFVGIGTANPSSSLHVAGDARIFGELELGSLSSQAFMRLFTEDGGGLRIISITDGTNPRLDLEDASGPAGSIEGLGNIGAGGGLQITGASGASLRLDPSGNVGIGTTSPTRKLEVAGSIKVGANDTIFSSNLSSNSPLRLQTAGTTRMYVDDVTGNVGIGTTNPASKLTVGDGDIAVIGTDSSVDLTLQNNEVGGVNWAIRSTSDASVNEGGKLVFDVDGVLPRLTITSAGSVGIGIGTPNPSSRLWVNGAIGTRTLNIDQSITLDESHSVLICNIIQGNITVSLPSASGIAGRQYTIRVNPLIGTPFANYVTIDPFGAELIDGSSSTSVDVDVTRSRTIVTDGQSWFTIAEVD